MKIKCITLFDITKTNVSNRRRDPTVDQSKERRQQSNLETLLQIISLRSQPEEITDPEMVHDYSKCWGSAYKNKKYQAWAFTFTVNYRAIFHLDGDDLGGLKLDCTNVPMITGLEETIELPPTLHSDGVLKNIHFEIATNEPQ